MSQGDTLLQVFRDRCTRVHTPATAQKYGWCASDVLRLASEHGGREIDLIGLFREPLLLGAILVAAERAGGGSEVSGWTVANRRTAMRSVAGLLAPELEAAGISEPSSVVDEALRACAERVGMRYRLPKAPVRNRGGHAPSPADVRAVMTAMREEPGWAGRRDAILVELMFVTGCRVNAALGLFSAHWWPRADTGSCEAPPRLRRVPHPRGSHAADRQLRFGLQQLVARTEPGHACGGRNSGSCAVPLMDPRSV